MRDRHVIQSYSDLAESYDGEPNTRSCWGIDTQRIVSSLSIKPEYELVVDVGCGTGGQLVQLASAAGRKVKFVGVEPAAEMRERARAATAELGNVDVREGRFEALPVDSGSADFVYSINSFHWSFDVRRAMAELRRVLAPGGEMDHFFIGRHIGREFIRVTTPVLLDYLGPQRLLEAATLRQAFTIEPTRRLFAEFFGADKVLVEERYDTYFDSVEGHLGWWVRIEPQLVGIPPESRDECNGRIKEALRGLETDRGVPYTKHTLHARVR